MENFYLGTDIDHEDISGNGLELFQNRRYSIFAKEIGLIWVPSLGEFLNKNEIISVYQDEIADSAAFFIGVGFDGNFPAAFMFALTISYNKAGKDIMELLVCELQKQLMAEE